jgi:hypothetical protein
MSGSRSTGLIFDPNLVADFLFGDVWFELALAGLSLSN